ncbi:Hypothetical predicted protein [Marmota monax]|uniref:Rho-GAP domain-containing protein n=1 Tax=Marmota monax TaxID=9995 RepID=A0A5E4CWF6_MARMO|nr:Hypothetical predicted protein [Marmota monax]
MNLAKEIQHANEEQETNKDNPNDKKYPNMCLEISRILLKSKDLLGQLPTANFNSLHYLIIHLKQVVDHAEENKMTSRDLGVIFAPCLMKQRPTGVPITNAILVEYVNKTRLVEFLITHSQKIFNGSLQLQDVTCNTDVVAPQLNQSCPSKLVISPKEREIQRSMKSLYFSSKEVGFNHYGIALELCDVCVNKSTLFELFILRCVLFF